MLWIVLSLAALLFLIGLLLTDPSAGIGLAIGLIAPAAIVSVVRFQRTRSGGAGSRRGRAGGRAAWNIVAVAVALTAFVIASLLLRSSNQHFGVGGPPPDFTIKEYRLVLTTAGKDDFSVRVEASGSMGESTIRINQAAEDPSDIVITEPPKKVRASGRGPVGLLREVTVAPPADPFLELVLPNGRLALGVLCSVACLEARVEVHGLSHGAFTEARDALDLNSSRFHGNDTVSWSPLDPGDELVFDYIRPPYHHFRAVLLPVLQAGSLGGLVLTLIGALLGIVGVVLLGMGKDRLKALFERFLARFTKRKPDRSKPGRRRPRPRQPKLTATDGRRH
ncbi:MAG TPA: hypothetical protein VGA30_10130 [Actinomycetota bacterium]